MTINVKKETVVEPAVAETPLMQRKIPVWGYFVAIPVFLILVPVLFRVCIVLGKGLVELLHI